jgi:UPF0716 protein FxsA
MAGATLGDVLIAIPIIWFVAELLVAIEVAHLIGVVAMLLALVASWPLGMWAMRSHGAGAMRKLRAAVAEQRAPAREVLDGALGLFGGLLLMIPGFLSDVLGLLLLFGPTRALARWGMMRTGRGYLLARVARVGSARRAYDVESTARDVPPPTLPV